MRYKCYCLTFAIGVLLAVTSFAWAQGRVVTGTITDEHDQGLPGVSIVVKGLSTGTISDADGKYSISVQDENAVLAFSFVGYKSIESTPGNQLILDVKMTPAINVLSEITVTGYGTQERKDITGAIDVAKEKELVALPTSSFENNLQGRVSGVNVITDGEPGAPPQVTIRGISTFAGSSSPLYVVDGNPTLDVTTFNITDVESITVLKDAGAASIYGSRAANGVILVTTKHGTAGTLKLSYSGYGGVQTIAKSIDNLLDTKGFADLYRLAYANSGQTPPPDNIYGNGPTPVIPDYFYPAGKMEGDPAVDPALYNYPNYAISKANKQGTNWFNEITCSAPIQNHSLDVSGGSKNSRYFIDFNYFNQQGIVIYTYSKRYSMRTNTEFKIKDHIKIGENMTWTYRVNSLLGSGLRPGTTSINASYGMPVIQPVFDIYGNPSNGGLNGSLSPYQAQKDSRNNSASDSRAFGNVYAEVDFLKNFTFRTALGGALQNGYFVSSENIYPPYNYSEGSYVKSDWNWQNVLTYKKKADLHSLTVLAGAEAIKTDIGRSLGGTRFGYFSNDLNFYTLSNGDAANQTNYSYHNTPSSLLGYFFRADYGYRDRYYGSITVRTDGSSKFVNNKWGTFPAATLGWRLSEESFLQGSKFINDLKARAGYGVMGDQINALSANSYSTYTSDPTYSYYDITGANTNAVQGYTPSFIGNPNGQWQRNISTNLGLDFSLFNYKFTGAVEFYRRVTDKLLYSQELAGTYGSPLSLYGTSLIKYPAQNVGSVENKGIDLNLGYQTRIGRNLKFNASMTFTTYNNKVIKVANNTSYFDPPSTPVRIQTGHPISAFYGYQIAGLWQSQGEVDQANATAPFDPSNPYIPPAFQAGAAPGRFRYKDVDGNKKIDQNDRTFIGNPNPKFIYGLNLSLSYKSFDFTAFFYGVYGNDIMNFNKRDFFANSPQGEGTGSATKDALSKSWLPTRTNTNIPKVELENGTFSSIANGPITSYFLEKGSYLRLKNFQVGYTFPKQVLSKAGVSTARIYGQVVNLFTITKYSGLDPELRGTPISFGIDPGNYPNPRQFIVGLKVEF